MKYLLSIFTCAIFFNINISAQSNYKCGTTQMMKKLIEKNPDLINQEILYDQLIQNHINNKTQQVNNKQNQNYIIPIVFHVIHQYGTENISDAQIFDAVRILNDDYSKQNADTSQIIAEFDTLAAKCDIEFRLAQKDPFGNCTNGIDRIYSHRTNDADDLSKLNAWSRDKYLNVWVVKTIGESGVAGYAYYPSAVSGNNYPIDGVIILNNYIGSIGTSSVNNSRALTHEIGHYLSLSHPWGSTNDPGVACGDDGINDTPYTKGFNFCPSSPSMAKICDTSIVENYQNFMDYSYCSKMFTIGQKNRMHATLNVSISDRNNLWTPSNLMATGTDTVTTNQVCSPIADFYSSKRFVCQGDLVTLTDHSWRTDITGVKWNIANGSPTTSTATNPTVILNQLYWQNISLTAYSANDSNTIDKNYLVYASAPWVDYTGTFSEGFETSSNFSQWVPMYNGYNDSKWQRTSNASYSGSKSLFLNAYNPPVINPPFSDYGIGKNDIDAIMSPKFDLSGLTSGVLNFKYACATYSNNSTEITEIFKIYYSPNCGKTWIPMFSRQGVSLVNNGFVSTSFKPTQNNQWEDVSVNIPVGAQSSHIRFKFEYTSGDYSNNFYIDDINISGIVGIEEENNTDKISVYPNPFNNSTTVSYELPKTEIVTMSIYDLLGNKVVNLSNETQNKGVHQLVIKKDNIPSGIYILKLTSNQGLNLSKKLVIQ